MGEKFSPMYKDLEEEAEEEGKLSNLNYHHIQPIKQKEEVKAMAIKKAATATAPKARVPVGPITLLDGIELTSIGRSMYPFNTMEVGQAFEVTSPTGVRAAIANRKKKGSSGTFRVGKAKDGKVYCLRVEDPTPVA